MNFLRHKIGGITFLTKSDIELTPLKIDSFQRFLTKEMDSEIYHRIQKVEEKDLTKSALNSKEKESISRCIIPSRLGPGSFILPPFVRNKEDGDCFRGFQSVQDSFDIPLFRSQAVRDRLEACLDHPERIGLLLHIFSLEIYDYNLHRIDLFYRSTQRWIFDDFPLDNGFRRMFTSFLPSFLALMLHSSGIVRNGRAALFLAPDAGGKSTAIANMNGGTILSDDQNILRKEGDTFMVHSTPWGAISHGPQQAPLGGFFLLEKAPNFTITQEKFTNIFQFLWIEHMHVWLKLPKHLRIKAFELLYNACSQTPCYRMRFPKDYIDWDAIDKAMNIDNKYK